MNGNFRIGEKVLCINNKPMDKSVNLQPPLKLHKEYTVVNALECACGSKMIDVDLPRSTAVTVCKCGTIIRDTNWWVNSVRFIRSSELDNVVEEVNELFIKETV